MLDLRVSLLVLAVFSVSIAAEEFVWNKAKGEPCEFVKKHAPMDADQCMAIAQGVDATEMILEKYYIGERITLFVNFTNINTVCTAYYNCKSHDKTHCLLPKRDLGVLCSKMDILRSPYGNCLRNLRAGDYPIKSSAIESLVFDYTNYGLTQKCIYFSHPEMIMNDLAVHCDENAAKSFDLHREALQKFFKC